MINNPMNSVLSAPTAANPVVLGIARAQSPFIRSLELIAATRTETRRKRPAMSDGTSPFVRFAVMNMMRVR